MNSVDLCLALVKSESEAEVIEVLKRSSYWDDETAWRYFGDRENNFVSFRLFEINSRDKSFGTSLKCLCVWK